MRRSCGCRPSSPARLPRPRPRWSPSASLQAGTKENVIPDEAIIKLNVRTFDEGVRKHVLAAIERIVNAEAAASGAPRQPEITPLDRYPLNVNDAGERPRRRGVPRHFSADRVAQTGPAPASEDFGCFGTEWQVPSVFWFVGGTDPEIYAKAKAAGRLNELPVNHSPQFAPVIHPTLETGVEAMVVGALAWLRCELTPKVHAVGSHACEHAPTSAAYPFGFAGSDCFRFDC